MRNFYLGISGYIFTIIAFSAALFLPWKYPYMYNDGGGLYFLWEFILIMIYLILSNKPKLITGKVHDYLWIIIILGIFLAIAISEGYRTFSILIVINFVSNSLINKSIPDIKILTIRFLILWSSVMIVLPLLTFFYEILAIIQAFFGSGSVQIMSQSHGGALEDPTNFLIWGVGYFSMLLVFDLFLHFKATHESRIRI